MDDWEAGFGEKSRLRLLLEHFSRIEDPRPSHRVAYPLSEVLLLTVCGTIADCDSYEAIGLWGERHLAFLRRFLPYYHGVPAGRWLTLLSSSAPSPTGRRFRQPPVVPCRGSWLMFNVGRFTGTSCLDGVWRTVPTLAGGAKLSVQKEVIHIEKTTAILVVAIVSAAFAFTTLVLKIIEVARTK